MPYAAELRLALLRCLRSPVCVVCGQKKDVKQCFCKTCYFALPAPMRNQLYARVSEVPGQFEDGYTQAMRYLHQLGMYVPRLKLPAEARKILQETGIAAAMRESRL